MGARPLYYTQVDRRLLFGSEVKSLLAFPGVTRAPDDDALADLVLDRWIDPHRTCFRDIYAVPPGHALHATPDRLTVRRHQDFDPSRELRFQRVDEYVDAFRDVFKQSVRRRIRSPRPVAVSVSGGVDSSSIFCQAVALAREDSAHQGIRGISMTFPAGSPADEQEFIDTLDAVSPQPVERMPVSEIRVLHDATRIIGHLERPELVWSTFPEVLGRARRAGCSVILDGYYGDEALFPRRYLVDLAYRGSWLKIRRDLREFGVWMNDDSHDWKVEFWNSLGRSTLPRPVFDAMKRGASRRRAARYPAWYTSAFVERLLDRQMSRFESPHRFASAHAQEC
jgi:asparagine synthase (glutamine-hydrolysing)